MESDDIRRNAVKGSDVKESSLQGVLSCPGSMRHAFGLCFDRSNQGPTSWESALEGCSDRKLRLPTVAEGLLVMRRVPTGMTLYWTDDHDMSDNSSALVTLDAGTGPSTGVTGRFDSNSYRCVTAARD